MINVYQFMFMFGDFDYRGILEVVDSLVEKKRGSYTEFLNMTIRELTSIVNTIINREREAELEAHVGDMKSAMDGAKGANKSKDASFEEINRIIEASR